MGSIFQKVESSSRTYKTGQVVYSGILHIKRQTYPFYQQKQENYVNKKIVWQRAASWRRSLKERKGACPTRRPPKRRQRSSKRLNIGESRRKRWITCIAVKSRRGLCSVRAAQCSRPYPLCWSRLLPPETIGLYKAPLRPAKACYKLKLYPGAGKPSSLSEHLRVENGVHTRALAQPNSRRIPPAAVRCVGSCACGLCVNVAVSCER